MRLQGRREDNVAFGKLVQELLGISEDVYIDAGTAQMGSSKPMTVVREQPRW